MCVCVCVCVYGCSLGHTGKQFLTSYLREKKSHWVYSYALFRTWFLHRQARQQPCDVLLCPRDWESQVLLYRQCLHQGGQPGTTGMLAYFKNIVKTDFLAIAIYFEKTQPFSLTYRIYHMICDVYLIQLARPWKLAPHWHEFGGWATSKRRKMLWLNRPHQTEMNSFSQQSFGIPSSPRGSQSAQPRNWLHATCSHSQFWIHGDTGWHANVSCLSKFKFTF